jgi:hypothetical protein
VTFVPSSANDDTVDSINISKKETMVKTGRETNE